ncbi:GTP 3',8-cyclase MoaA [candidate division KSB1 bacterium]|nr:GTP 3',8-cyclase MoaA [candidate division KSB1 bacterium]
MDRFGRKIEYLRLGVTDRCNLRCTYCMPPEGISCTSKEEILTFSEMERLVRLFVTLGISKLRLTGGEPFVRKDLIKFLWRMQSIPELKQICITTNGVLTAPLIPELKEMGLSGLNLSLDSLSDSTYKKITGQNQLQSVLQSFHQALQYKIPLKINTVIQPGLNFHEMIPLSRLAENNPVEVRFIEQMPFRGDHAFVPKGGSAKEILYRLRLEYPDMVKIQKSNSTAQGYSVPGFNGTLGIIAGYSRTFCNNCNRIRITPSGLLKTCLYDHGVVDLKQLLRSGCTDSDISSTISKAVINRSSNGFEAENKNTSALTHSMAAIGG